MAPYGGKSLQNIAGGVTREAISKVTRFRGKSTRNPNYKPLTSNALLLLYGRCSNSQVGFFFFGLFIFTDPSLLRENDLFA